jgi:hypothetical protein
MMYTCIMNLPSFLFIFAGFGIHHFMLFLLENILCVHVRVDIILVSLVLSHFSHFLQFKVLPRQC